MLIHRDTPEFSRAVLVAGVKHLRAEFQSVVDRKGHNWKLRSSDLALLDEVIKALTPPKPEQPSLRTLREGDIPR